MTAPVDVLAARIDAAALVVTGSMRCECWLPDEMEFGPACPKCQLLDALGLEEIDDEGDAA